MKKERTPIVTDTKRQLLIECGYRCSVPNCATQWPTLQFHHIDENPSNNANGNVLMLCPTHHQMVTSGHIDKKSCELLKKSLTTFAKFDVAPHIATRNRLLYSLTAELQINWAILNDKQFGVAEAPATGPVVYSHLLHAALDQAVSSGVFIHDLDGELFSLIYQWAEMLHAFNHRLDLTEFRTVLREPTDDDRIAWHQKLVTGKVLASARHACRALIDHLLQEYSSETGISADTILFKRSTSQSKQQ